MRRKILHKRLSEEDTQIKTILQYINQNSEMLNLISLKS